MPEYVLKPDGRMIRRPNAMTMEGEVDIPFEDALFASITNRSLVKLHDVFHVEPYGVAHVCLNQKGDYAFVSVRLEKLVMRVTIRTKDKIVTPSFEDKGDVVELHWTLPEDMVLVHCSELSRKDYAWRATVWYLFAFANTNDVYQLPLANLYTDGHLCTGHGTLNGDSIANVVRAGLVQFHQSQWNSHLIRENAMFENSQLLFRFNSTPDSFVSMPPEKHWAKYCNKIGTAMLQQVII